MLTQSIQILGYALACGTLAVLAYGGWQVCAGWRNRMSSLRRAGKLLLVLLGFRLGLSNVFEAMVERNPTLDPKVQLIGSFQDGQDLLWLFPDVTFQRVQGKEQITGLWYRDDWNLRLAEPREVEKMRFVTVFGQVRLLMHPCVEGDTWSDGLGVKAKAIPEGRVLVRSGEGEDRGL